MTAAVCCPWAPAMPTVRSGADDVIGQCVEQCSRSCAVDAVADSLALSFAFRKIRFDDSYSLECYEVLTGGDPLGPDGHDDLRDKRVRVHQKPLDDVDSSWGTDHLVSVGHDRRQGIEVVGDGHQDIFPDASISAIPPTISDKLRLSDRIMEHRSA